ncbi:MAG: P-loop NTPase fold protein [Gammaproteobacteria bacterium]|nr:P-loop NTPase fold protein [Gammaproteobacteria bacterium]
MSIQIANRQLKKFLNSLTNEVIVIKGKWGTGKTFLWDKLLKEAQDSNEIIMTHYSYVSAFGLNSIDALRDKIFENQIPKELIGKPINLETFVENINKTFSHLLKKGSKSIVRIISETINNKLFGSNETLPISSSMLYMSISKAIICIDDLERKGSGITQNEILGLVSDLKYQKKCKVILIFNDAAFTPKDKKRYEELREKVIDKEIHFNPTPKECTDILYAGVDLGKDKSDIPILCNKLGISNIRILFSIDKLANDLLLILQNCASEIIHKALSTLVLHCYCYYSKDESLPSFEILQTLTYVQTYQSKEEEKNQEKWVSKLQEYGYMNTDDFDLLIYEGVRSGYFDEDKIREQVKIITEKITASKSHDSFYEAWELFHGSFKDNKQEVVIALHDSFTENYKYLSLTDLNATVLVLRVLDEGHKADSLINLYLDDKKSNAEHLAKVYAATHFGEKIDPMIKTSIEGIFSSLITEKTLHDVLLSIASRDSWSEKEKYIIEQASSDEIYNLLKDTAGDDLKKIIKFGFMLSNEKTKEAMNRIRGENSLNRLRTDKYFRKA